jgi:hypothetical protein
MKLHQRQLPDPSRHFYIALKAIVLIPHSLELFLVPFGNGSESTLTPVKSITPTLEHSRTAWRGQEL